MNKPLITPPLLSGKVVPLRPPGFRPTNQFLVTHALGYTSLVAIIPAGATLSERSSLYRRRAKGKDSRGKSPGVRLLNGEWTGVDWMRTPAPTLEKMAEWASWGAGVGLRLGDGLVAIDSDTIEKPLARDVFGLLKTHIPGAHCKRFGRHPKFLVLLRVVQNTAYRCIDFPKGQRVELLTAGRQCVVHGVHPVTGEGYWWVDEADEVGDMPARDDLVEATGEQLEAFFAALATLPGAGPQILERAAAERRDVGQAKLVGAPEHVRAAVALLPNTTAAFSTRTSYLSVGYAIKAALPDHPDEVFELFEDWCDRWADPPDGVGNDPETAASDWARMHAPFEIGAGWLYDKAAALGGFDKAAVHLTPIAEEDTRAAPRADEEAWAAPVDIFGDGSHGAPVELQQGILPPVLDRVAIDMADRIGVSLAFAGAAVLATASAAIGAKLKIQPRQLDTLWTQPAFLWFGLVEDPGGKKSPIIAAATAPLRTLNDQCALSGKRALDAWKVRQKSKKSDGKPCPPITRYVVDNFTMEALCQVLSANPQGVLIAPDELSGLITSLDAYKSAKGADRSSLLRLFDGGSFQSDRVGTGQTHVETWGASVLGGIQPKRIAAMSGNMEEDGLLQRFLPILGDGERRPGEDRPVDVAAMADYTVAITAFAEQRYLLPTPIRLTAGAAGELKGVWRRAEALAGLSDVSDAWRGHLGKWPGIAARVTLIFHAFDCFSLFGTSLEGVPVEQDTARRAARFCDFLLAHALRFYGSCVGLGRSGDDARWISGHILARHEGNATITRRTIERARHHLRDEHVQLNNAMRFLEHVGWVRAETSNLDRRNLPQSWQINPRIFEDFRSRAESERANRDRAIAAAAEAGAHKRAILDGSREYPHA